ncbi:MAG: hypothetical protein ACLTD7_07930 [Clostridia bacterium]
MCRYTKAGSAELFAVLCKGSCLSSGDLRVIPEKASARKTGSLRLSGNDSSSHCCLFC